MTGAMPRDHGGGIDAAIARFGGAVGQGGPVARG